MSNIQMHPVESSQIAAIGYHPESQTLAVEFKARLTKEGASPTKGPTYHYANVSPAEYEAFKSAKSKGSHFAAHFVNAKKYSYTKQG